MSRAKPLKPGFDPAWVVILCGVSAALHVAKLIPALPALREAFGLSLVAAGFLLSTVQLAGMTLGLFIGLAADGLGARKSMLAGLLTLAVAGVLGTWVQGMACLLALRALEGVGMLLVCTPAPHLIRQLVPPERLGRRLGLWSAYMPFGTALALLAGPGLILAAGWQVLWWVLSLFSVLMAVWLWRVLPGDQTMPAGNPNAAMWTLRLRQTLTASGPWLVALCFAVYSAQWLAVIGFLPVVYAEAGVAAGATAWLTGLAAAANIVGNVASGRFLSNGVRPQTLLFTGYTVMGIAAVLAFSQSAIWAGQAAPPLLRYAAILLFSMVGGLVPATLFVLAVRFAPSDDTASTTVGWMQQGSALGQFVGPPLVAWVASRAGNWSQTWQVTGLFCLAGLLLTWRVARRLDVAHKVSLPA